MSVEDLSQILVAFTIPVGIVVVSWLLQKHFELHQNSGYDLFIFIFSSYLMLLVNQPEERYKINHYFANVYGQVFGAALVVSLALLIYSATVQNRIYEYASRKRKYYPLSQVVFCWVGATASVGFLIYAVFGA